MSIVKIEDVAFVRLRAPDLAQMRAFLEDFGLVVAEATDRRLSMRGSGTSPVLHITELGEPGFVSVGFKAKSLADLQKLADAEGAALEDLDAPGGGKRITLTDPDGHRVEVVAGQAPAAPLESPRWEPWNTADERPRLRKTKRIAPGPALVARLGHAVLNVSNFRASEAWYKDRFGFITSDEIQATPDFSIGAFMRCDRGDDLTDHHTLFLLQAPSGPGFNHAAYEVHDLDDLMRGHERLKQNNRHAEWGIGRHILGSQVFDYWRDPWGHILEHWTDGDLFTANDGSNAVPLPELLGVQWGPQAPPTMGH